MKIIARTKSWLPKINQFLQEDVWLTDLSDSGKRKRLGVHLTRIGMTAANSYKHDNCSLQASALTYITLVSLVPIIAIMFSFTKGMGMQRLLMDKIGMEKVVLEQPNDAGENFEFKILQPIKNDEGKVTWEPDGYAYKMPEPIQKAMIGIMTYAEHTNFAALGLVGSFMLLISVVTSIAKLEDCFNRIWGVTKPRTIAMKFAEYLMILIMTPLAFVLLTSVSAVLTSERILGIFQGHASTVAVVIVMLIRGLSSALVLLLFAGFYMFMPHTKVKFMPALLAGVVTGLLWFGVQWVYVEFQVGLAKFNKIYGTFAVVPFFLAWLYANWSIVLLGGELSYAIQNHRVFRVEKLPESIPEGACVLLGQLIMFECSQAFDKGHEGWDPLKFGIDNSLPLKQLQYTVETLVKAKLLLQVTSDSDEIRFVPARSPSKMTFAQVEDAFLQSSSVDAKVYLGLLPKELAKRYVDFYADYAKDLEALNFEM